MGRRGPLPQPTALRAVRGPQRADRINYAEPPTIPVATAPDPPEWLDEIGRAVWGTYAPQLAATKVLGEQDGLALAMLCDQASVYRKCADFLRQKGESYVVLDGDGNPKAVQAYPQVALRQKAAAELRRWVEHFGLSPASRARVQRAGEPEGPADALTSFLRGRAS